jgi:hypothetical protein
MNPIFDPGTSSSPQFVPGTNPQLFAAPQSLGGGDPGTVGGGGGQLAQTPGTTPATAGGSGVPGQSGGAGSRPSPTPAGWLGNTNAQHWAAPSWYTPPAAMKPTGWEASNFAAAAAWDPAMHPGRSRPQPTSYRAGHVTPAGFDWTRFANAGNMGASAPGSRSPTGNLANYPQDTTPYDWMADTSVQWGGGPGGYLPIGYQAQNYDYYRNTNNLAPWEQRYAADTWTQNYDPSQPGYFDTRRLANDPTYGANLRG